MTLHHLLEPRASTSTGKSHLILPYMKLSVAILCFVVLLSACPLEGDEAIYYPYYPDLPPDSLTVLNAQDGPLRGNGDEPMVARITFRATYGVVGSTTVSTDTELLVLGEDLEANDSVDIPSWLGRAGHISFGNFAFPLDPSSEEIHPDYPAVVAGTTTIFLEDDTVNAHEKIRNMINKQADRFQAVLDFYIADPRGSLANLTGKGRARRMAEMVFCSFSVIGDSPLPDFCEEMPAPPGGVSGGGTLFELIGAWFKANIGPDYLDHVTVVSWNIPPSIQRAFILGIEGMAAPYLDENHPFPSCNANDLKMRLHLCPWEDKPVGVTYDVAGDGGRWQISSQITAGI